MSRIGVWELVILLSGMLCCLVSLSAVIVAVAVALFKQKRD